MNNVEFTTAYTDCHVYLMNRRLIEIIITLVSEENNLSDRFSLFF